MSKKIINTINSWVDNNNARKSDWIEDSSPLLPFAEDTRDEIHSPRSKLQREMRTLKKLFCTEDTIKHLTISLFFVILSAAQYISLPLWHLSFSQQSEKKDPIPSGVPFLMLFLISFLLLLSCGISSVVLWYYTGKPKTAKLSQYWHYYVIIGFFLALNGVLLVYTSSPYRTPPTLQMLLLTSGFVWILPTNRMCVNEKSHYKYCSCTPIIAMTLVIYGIIMAFLPAIISYATNQTTIYFQNKGLVWFFLFFLSMFPGAVANIFIERFFKKRYKSSFRDNSKNFMYDIMNISFCSYFSQFIFICVLFFVDTVPFIGTSKNLLEFTTGLHEAISFSFSSHSAYRIWIYGFIFYVSFFGQTLFSIFISPDTAKFVNIATTFATPVAVLIYKMSNIYENPEEEKISPYWAVIPSLVLLLFGTITWKLWISNEKKRVQKESVASSSLLLEPMYN